ncbi:hypothetical protein CDG77_02400 [Nostoc sp. 'Peltigera membranacea cyanobiont' 213]|uniref:hypothetical protein n=1 Tax=Nostoc sp. 'Peltigera membranacea cyanobiont' 213 TaxID=2014530 RepID=UPI000B959E92|nr:hypothetical protein [Nostoc sp. 'Peltigera membranacea cyanobiont' 213]OYD99134.1 hypothetical protein CDG77_02400 [Nostoc sp. 'Peltigera membranacea cyanobiont' 213]
MTPLKRREFGQLAAASLTSTVVAGLSTKALAQNKETLKGTIYAVNLLTSDSQNLENETPAVVLSTADLATGKILSKVNRLALSVENPSSVPKSPRAFFLRDSNRVTKVIKLGDGSILISTVSHRKNGYFNHLISTVGNANIPVFRGKKVLGFKKSNQTLESVLSLPNNQLLCLVATEGIPPCALKTLDLKTGKILSNDELDLPTLTPTHRFAHLCQLKENIFATETGSEGFTSLISMNLQEKAILTGKVKINRLSPLNFKGRPLVIKDLNFSTSGQLYALATNNNGKKNGLYTVDIKTGKMELVRDFEADKFVLS